MMLWASPEELGCRYRCRRLPGW